MVSKIKQLINRIYHVAARLLPGAYYLRPLLHRMRGVHIGEKIFIGADVYIDDLCPDQVFIESAAEVNARCIILAHDGYSIRPVYIRHHAMIGVGTTILPGVEIGAYAIVGANSTVSRDIPPGSIAFGSPAKVFRFIKETSELEKWKKDGRVWLEYTNDEKSKLIPHDWDYWHKNKMGNKYSISNR